MSVALFPEQESLIMEMSSCSFSSLYSPSIIKDNTQMNTRKKIKQNQSEQLPKTIIVQLQSANREEMGTFELPVESGPKELQQLLDHSNKDQQQYNFFHLNKEIKTSLSTFFKQTSLTSFEANFIIVCHPTSNFKVKPITRAASSMYGHTEAVLCLGFSPDSSHLASGSGDATLRFWDIHTQTPLKEVKCDNWVMIVQWSPCAEKLAYAEKNGNITVHTLKSQTNLKLIGHSKWVTSIAWIPLHLSESNQCDHLVSASKDFTLRLWNTNSGVCLRSFGNHTKCVTKVVWSGRNEIYSCSQDQKINCFDGNGTPLRELKKHSHWVNTMSLSTDHTLKRGCFQPGKLFEGTQKKHKALQIYKKAVQQHDERLVTGSDDFTLMLFQLPNRKPLKQMMGHARPVNYVQFSPDGRYIVSGSFDKKIKLWDGYNGDFMCTFDGHVGPVYLICWSADSRFLVSGSQDSTLKLWDIRTRKLMMDLPGHADQVYALDWDVSGRLVASGGKDRQVKLWVN